MHGVGQNSHRAEAFVAIRRSEDRSLAVANTTKYLEGGTSRTLTGPEGTKGATEREGRTREETQPGEKGPNRSNPKQQKQKRKVTKEGKNNNCA